MKGGVIIILFWWAWFRAGDSSHIRDKIVGIFFGSLFIALPRIYLGLHYPTDIIGGALIGVFITYLSSMFLVGNAATRFAVARAESHPQLFYPLFFLLTYQIADLFTGVREILSYADEWVRHVVL